MCVFSVCTALWEREWRSTVTYTVPVVLCIVGQRQKKLQQQNESTGAIFPRCWTPHTEAKWKRAAVNALSNSVAQRRQCRQVGIIHIDELSLGGSCKIAYINTICLRCWFSCVLTAKEPLQGSNGIDLRPPLLCDLGSEPKGKRPPCFRNDLADGSRCESTFKLHASTTAKATGCHRCKAAYLVVVHKEKQLAQWHRNLWHTLAASCRLSGMRGLPGQF